MIRLTLEKTRPTRVRPTPRILEVAGMFGLGLDEQLDLRVLPPVTLDLAPGRLIFITGPSGSGKSTLLHELRHAAGDHPELHPIDYDPAAAQAGPTRRGDQGDPSPALVDALGPGSLKDAMRWLSLAGLSDAFVMLRTPNQLSDGQRHRFALATAIARAEAVAASPPPAASTTRRLPLILADEFAATLDRTTAAVLARNVRRWTTRSAVCFVAATTHDDLLEPLDPDTLVHKPLGASVQVLHRPDAPAREQHDATD